MIYNLRTKEKVAVNKIGGKANSLIAMTGAGFNVPEGIVLSTDFFEPWLDLVKKSNEWQINSDEIATENCDALIRKANDVEFSSAQKKVFEKAMDGLKGEIFAVRSSSPQEDLAGTSFAGMYETYLGVKKNELEKNIIGAFSSMFDYRVIHYKQQNGLDYQNADMAVVVQRQIASDVSGVGFSLNPLNNDYDEAVINANFGLGESVVSGVVTPDQFIVNKVNN